MTELAHAIILAYGSGACFRAAWLGISGFPIETFDDFLEAAGAVYGWPVDLLLWLRG